MPYPKVSYAWQCWYLIKYWFVHEVFRIRDKEYKTPKESDRGLDFVYVQPSKNKEEYETEEKEDVMKIYKNGDRCPCCGKVLEGLSDDSLLLFSQLCNVAGLSDLGGLDLEIQDIDTGILKPPDAGIYPPVKPVFDA